MVGLSILPHANERQRRRNPRVSPSHARRLPRSHDESTPVRIQSAPRDAQSRSPAVFALAALFADPPSALAQVAASATSAAKNRLEPAAKQSVTVDSVLAESIKLAQDITDPPQKSAALAKIIEVQIKLNRLTEALQTTWLIPSSDSRARAFSQIAFAQADTGKLDAPSPPPTSPRVAKLPARKSRSANSSNAITKTWSCAESPPRAPRKATSKESSAPRPPQFFPATSPINFLHEIARAQVKSGRYCRRREIICRVPPLHARFRRVHGRRRSSHGPVAAAQLEFGDLCGPSRIGVPHSQRRRAGHNPRRRRHKRKPSTEIASPPPPQSPKPSPPLRLIAISTATTKAAPSSKSPEPNPLSAIFPPRKTPQSKSPTDSRKIRRSQQSPSRKHTPAISAGAMQAADAIVNRRRRHESRRRHQRNRRSPGRRGKYRWLPAPPSRNFPPVTTPTPSPPPSP